MTWIVVLWSYASMTCTHPDATATDRQYASRTIASLDTIDQIVDFERANPTREVIKFEVMTKERWEFERSSYNCSRLGGAR